MNHLQAHRVWNTVAHAYFAHMASSALQLYPYQSDSSDCKFKHGTKRILFRHAMLAEGPATLRKLLKDYLRPAVDNELRFPEVDATAFTALTQIVYDDIDGNDTDDAVWLDKTTLLPHARVYLLAREYGLLELMKTARGKLVKVLRHSRDLPMPPTGAVDLLTSIKEIFGGTTADDDNEIRIWLIRYCTCHIRELPNSHTHRDKLGEIMSEHGALGSTILLLQYDDGIDVVTLQSCAGCSFRWVTHAEARSVEPRDWCRNCDYGRQASEDPLDDPPSAVRRGYLQDPLAYWLDVYSDADK